MLLTLTFSYVPSGGSRSQHLPKQSLSGGNQARIGELPLERKRAVADFWDDEFDWSIPLPGGGELVTFRDAGDYIDKLPKREQEKLEWQLAIKDLMRAAAVHGPWKLLARIAIMHGKAEPPIDNPNDAPPAPKWRSRGKRDPWRG